MNRCPNQKNFRVFDKTFRQVLLYFFLITTTVVFLLLYSSSTNSKFPNVSRFEWISLKKQTIFETLETQVTEISPTTDLTKSNSFLNSFSGKDYIRSTQNVNSISINYSTKNVLPLAEINNSITKVEKGFLVYSDNCKIPDVNPFHPSIKRLISYSNPINCSDYAPLTRTVGDQLVIDYKIADSKGFRNFTCCYKVLYRDQDGISDNKYKFSKRCFKVEEEKTKIKDEFIVVECKDSQNGTTFYVEYHSFIHEKAEVEKRCQNSSANYSLLLVGIDSVSRMNMHRQFKEMYKYLNEELEALEMYGFNKVGDNTFPNVIPMTLGYGERELDQVCWNSSDYHLDGCDFIWKRFQKNGYRTLYAEDTPHISTFNYIKKGFAYQPTDYYFRNFILAYETNLGRGKVLNCELCVGSVSETEAVLQWVEKFAIEFKNKPYFAYAWLNSLTHDFLNMGSAGDLLYKNFFKRLHKADALKNTIIIVMGDHGMRWGEIRSTYIGRLEERLPMLMVVLPPKFNEEFPLLSHTLKENRHKLVTPFDLYATFNHILSLHEEWEEVNTAEVMPQLREAFANRSLSLFSPIPADRSCEDASINEHFCTCEMSLKADPKSEEAKFVALFLVNEINSKLKTRSDVCAILMLEEIKQARLWHPPHGSSTNHSSTSSFTVTIKTAPGDAIFEGTARYQSHKNVPELVGTISRLNLYGNQSYCVHDAILKKYCYCISS